MMSPHPRVPENIRGPLGRVASEAERDAANLLPLEDWERYDRHGFHLFIFRVIFTRFAAWFDARLRRIEERHGLDAGEP